MTTTAMTEAYEMGKADAERYDSLEMAYYEMDFATLDRIVCDPVLSNSYEAGFSGRSPLRRVRGWRYGSIPVNGYSTNHRDQETEAGVSIMALGEPGAADQTDGTFALFNDGRPLVRVEGWLIYKRGSDGEPLLVGAVEVTE